MSVAFSVNVYGTVDQQPPYVSEESGNAAFVQGTFSSPQVASFPSAPVNVWPILPGVKIGAVYCYSVIELPQTGLQLHSEKYIAKDTVATIASLRG